MVGVASGFSPEKILSVVNLYPWWGLVWGHAPQENLHPGKFGLPLRTISALDIEAELRLTVVSDLSSGHHLHRIRSQQTVHVSIDFPDLQSKVFSRLILEV